MKSKSHISTTGMLTIVLPYPGAERQTPYWARGEDQIDWQRGGLAAERCTVAFAAVELRDRLLRMWSKRKIVFGARIPATGKVVVIGVSATIKKRLGLALEGIPTDPQGYVMRSVKIATQTLVLAGAGREGALYSAYAWLEALGWRWQHPGSSGEIAPANPRALRLTGWDMVTTPDFPLFRGFHGAFKGKESTDLILWMARNRLNTWCHHPASAALMRKLGFRFISGGHVLERILDPDLPQTNGRTLFETHPEWFAQVKGNRIRAQAHRYQFCVANNQAVKHVAKHIVEHIRTDWKETDWQNIWMFDTWAGWCECDRCRAIGNESDLYLHFLSRMRTAVDAAEKKGTIKRNPGLVLVAYEGTPSLIGPTKGIPDNLASGRDLVLYAPINRCYAHTMECKACDELNTHYAEALEEWGRESHRMPVAMLEYYNVSKFEDLPLLFTRTMGTDIAYYHRVGVRGMSYMHVPVALWGPRALTQSLYARLSWDTKAAVDQIVSDYLQHRYGELAAIMGVFYDELETAYANVTAWRNWLEEKTINRRLLDWDGVTKPKESLFVLKHLQPKGGQAIGPQESLRHLKRAEAALHRAQKEKTPVSIRRRLEEDARSFRYGDESFRFYWAVAQIHDAEWQGNDKAARRIWREVSRLAVSLDSYYVPFDYEHPGPGVRAMTGLARSQLQPLVDTLRDRYE